MKKCFSHLCYLLTLLVIFAFEANAQTPATDEVHWVSFNQLDSLQKVAPKPVFIDVYTHWCGPCRKFAKESLTDTKVINYLNTHFYSIKFNGEGNAAFSFNGNAYANPGFDANKSKNQRNAMHDYTKVLQIVGYPTIVILEKGTSDNQKSFVGFHNKRAFMKLLEGIVAG